MDRKRSTPIISVLKFLRRLFLIVLILVGSFATFYGINMHYMQMSQISKASKYLDAGEISEVSHLVNKDMIITQGLLYLSFIVSVCCLIMIIIFIIYFPAHKVDENTTSNTI